MRLIATKCPPGEKADRLRYIRNDGSFCESAMPRQGALPHDLIHYVVESNLGLTNGFLGLVARGADAAFVMELTHDRRGRDVEHQAVQAEAIVEALQTQLWSGSFDLEAFMYGVATATAARSVPSLSIEMLPLESLLFDEAMRLGERWSRVPSHGSLELEFGVGAD